MPQSKEFVYRILKYRNILSTLKNLGIIKVFSDNLGEASGIVSSQVRRDFGELKIKGNKKGGYNMHDLINRLDTVLGKNTKQKVIIVGCGKIGQAILGYDHFPQNIKLVAGFDLDPEKNEIKGNIPIYPIKKMKEIVTKNHVKVGIITVPESAVTDVYEQMIDAGIKGVLNFSKVHLRETAHVIVNTVNIELQIENLSYFVNVLEGKD